MASFPQAHADTAEKTVEKYKPAPEPVQNVPDQKLTKEDRNGGLHQVGAEVMERLWDHFVTAEGCQEISGAFSNIVLACKLHEVDQRRFYQRVKQGFKSVKPANDLWKLLDGRANEKEYFQREKRAARRLRVSSSTANDLWKLLDGRANEKEYFQREKRAARRLRVSSSTANDLWKLLDGRANEKEYFQREKRAARRIRVSSSTANDLWKLLDGRANEKEYFQREKRAARRLRVSFSTANDLWKLLDGRSNEKEYFQREKRAARRIRVSSSTANDLWKLLDGRANEKEYFQREKRAARRLRVSSSTANDLWKLLDGRANEKEYFQREKRAARRLRVSSSTANDLWKLLDGRANEKEYFQREKRAARRLRVSSSTANDLWKLLDGRANEKEYFQREKRAARRLRVSSCTANDLWKLLDGRANEKEYFQREKRAARRLRVSFSTANDLWKLLDGRANEKEYFQREKRAARRLRVSSSTANDLWKLLDGRANEKEYFQREKRAARRLRVLIVGGGPCGLRMAIECAFLGAKVVVLEKESNFSRMNVLHFWSFVQRDLLGLGATFLDKTFRIDEVGHITTCRLQYILLKLCLLIGVDFHTRVQVQGLVEPDEKGKGWRAELQPSEHYLSDFEFDVVIGASGAAILNSKVLPGFPREYERGNRTIGITANFINFGSVQEKAVPEIPAMFSGEHPSWFKQMKGQTELGLESILYSRDESHHFLVTADKTSLIKAGVFYQDHTSNKKLLSAKNVNRVKLEDLVQKAADYATDRAFVKNTTFAPDHLWRADVAVHDLSSRPKAASASRFMERKGFPLLLALVGDSLQAPFWPLGAGLSRGFLSVLDTAFMIRNYAKTEYAKNPRIHLEYRERLYHLSSNSSPENLRKNLSKYTIVPWTRYNDVYNLDSDVTQQIMEKISCLLDLEDEDWAEKRSAVVEPAEPRIEAGAQKQLGIVAATVKAAVKWKTTIGTSQATTKRKVTEKVIKWVRVVCLPYNRENIIHIRSCFKHECRTLEVMWRYRPDLFKLGVGHNLCEQELNHLFHDTMHRDFGIEYPSLPWNPQDPEFIDAMLSYLLLLQETLKKFTPLFIGANQSFSAQQERDFSTGASENHLGHDQGQENHLFKSAKPGGQDKKPQIEDQKLNRVMAFLERFAAIADANEAISDSGVMIRMLDSAKASAKALGVSLREIDSIFEQSSRPKVNQPENDEALFGARKSIPPQLNIAVNVEAPYEVDSSSLPSTDKSVSVSEGEYNQPLSPPWTPSPGSVFVPVPGGRGFLPFVTLKGPDSMNTDLRSSHSTPLSPLLPAGVPPTPPKTPNRIIQPGPQEGGRKSRPMPSPKVLGFESLDIQGDDERSSDIGDSRKENAREDTPAKNEENVAEPEDDSLSYDSEECSDDEVISPAQAIGKFYMRKYRAQGRFAKLRNVVKFSKLLTSSTSEGTKGVDRNEGSSGIMPPCGPSQNIKMQTSMNLSYEELSDAEFKDIHAIVDCGEALDLEKATELATQWKIRKLSTPNHPEPETPEPKDEEFKDREFTESEKYSESDSEYESEGTDYLSVIEGDDLVSVRSLELAASPLEKTFDGDDEEQGSEATRQTLALQHGGSGVEDVSEARDEKDLDDPITEYDVGRVFHAFERALRDQRDSVLLEGSHARTNIKRLGFDKDMVDQRLKELAESYEKDPTSLPVTLQIRETQEKERQLHERGQELDVRLKKINLVGSRNTLQMQHLGLVKRCRGFSAAEARTTKDQEREISSLAEAIKTHGTIIADHETKLEELRLRNA